MGKDFADCVRNKNTEDLTRSLNHPEEYTSSQKGRSSMGVSNQEWLGCAGGVLFIISAIVLGPGGPVVIGAILLIGAGCCFLPVFLRAQEHMICIGCGTRGSSVTRTQGSFIIEVILWLCFLVPGLIYTVWRLTTRKKVCPVCSGSMIPLNTPVGRKLSEQTK